MAGQNRDLPPVLHWEQLQDFRRRLRIMGDDLLEKVYSDKLSACQFTARDPPTARYIQELVQVWRELDRRKPKPRYPSGMR